MSKQCPMLLLAYWITADIPFSVNDKDCIREDCAWWNEHLGCCGLIATGMALGVEIERREMTSFDCFWDEEVNHEPEL